MTLPNIIHYIFYVQTNVKLYHWMTKSYARHKASDEFTDKFAELTDKFVEVYIGRYGRSYLTKHNKTVSLTHLDDKTFPKFLDETAKQFMQFVDEKDTDLVNIRDEIIELINQTKYLCTLE
jgi:hypothetical protein